MRGWELVFFVATVVGAVCVVVAAAWIYQWKRDPERFKESFRRSPNAGSLNHWNSPKP